MSTAADRVQWPPNSGGAAIVGKVVIVGGESGSSSRPECGAAQLDARYRRAIVVVTAVAAVWRLGYLVATKWNQQLLFNDSLYYSSQAYENAHGNWFRDFPGAHPGAEHGPLTSLVLTPASLLSHHEFWQRATNTIVGIAVVPLIALLARRLAGRRVAVIAAVIAALYPNLWMNDSLVMAESISTLLVVVAMLLAIRFRERLDIRSAVVCGAVVGLASLARSELLILAPVFALLGVRERGARASWRGAAALTIAALAAIAPWVAYNVPRFDHLVLISTNEGGALRGANCDDTYSGPAQGGWSLWCVVDDVDRPGEDASGRALRLRKEALSYMRHHMGQLPDVMGARLLRSVDLYGLGDLVRFDVGEERARWASWSGILSFWLLAPLAVIGWRRRPIRSGFILGAPVVGVLVTTVVFYGSHRLRTPMEPVIVICAAMALCRFPPIRRLIDRQTST